MRFFNGEVQVDVDDLSTGGFGMEWGHTRSYSNRMAYDYDYGNGYNWLVRQWPYLVAQGGLVPFAGSSSSGSGASGSSSGPGVQVPATIVVVRTSRSPFWFDYYGSQYVGRHGILHTLVYDPVNNLFNLTTPTGEVTQFQDFIQTAAPHGLFKRHTIAGGQAISVTSYVGQRIGEIQRAATSGGVTTTESFVYTFVGGDAPESSASAPGRRRRLYQRAASRLRVLRRRRSERVAQRPANRGHPGLERLGLGDSEEVLLPLLGRPPFWRLIGFGRPRAFEQLVSLRLGRHRGSPPAEIRRQP